MRRMKQASVDKGRGAEQSVRRRHRHRDRRRQRRREGFLREVAASVTPELLSPEDAVDLVCGSVTAARYALKRVRRSQLANSSPPQPAADVSCAHIPSAVRPASQLSRLNRSATFPSIVPKKITLDAVSAAEVLAFLSAQCKIEPPHQLLDLFAVGTGLSWELSAEILFAHQLIAAQLTARQIVAVKNARLFWDQYSQGRTRFGSLAASGHVQRFCGDWAYFGHTEFANLLPGIVVPTRLKRYDYLTNYGLHATGFSLDVYDAPTMAPLFQHPFLERFNPLSFGSAG
jgi:hypothetical protein